MNITKPRKKRGKQKVNTLILFNYFCTPKDNLNLPTYQDVADHFNMDRNIVEQLGVRNNWVNDRKMIYRKATEKNATELFKSSDNVKIRMQDFWTRSLDLLETQLAEITKLQALAIAEPKPEKRRKLLLKAYEIKYTMEAFQIVNSMMRLWAGMATDVTRQEQIQKNIELSSDDLDKVDKYLQSLEQKAEDAIQQETITNSSNN